MKNVRCFGPELTLICFAWQLKTLGRYYEDAMILCERNNHGLVTLKYLVDVHGYPNVYSEKILDERSNRSAKKMVFHICKVETVNH